MENSYASMFAAMEIMREELLKHDWLYEGFEASILSALRDYDWHGNTEGFKEISKYILDRLIGAIACPGASEYCNINAEEKGPEKELVNHPDHYNITGRKECIEEMVDIWGPQAVALWCEMTAYKYSYRVGHKDPEDLERRKIKWYMDKCQEIRDGIRERKLSTETFKKSENREKEAMDLADLVAELFSVCNTAI